MMLMKKMKLAMMEAVTEARDVYTICVGIDCENKMSDAQATELEAQTHDIKDADAVASKLFAHGCSSLGC